MYAIRRDDSRLSARTGFSDDQWASFWDVLSVTGTLTGAYHGYVRNNSVGWAIGWAIMGGLFPYITIPVSLAQGFGQRKRA